MKKFLSTKKVFTTAMTFALSTALLVGVADAKPENGNGSQGNNGKSPVHSVSQSKSNAKFESKQAQSIKINQLDTKSTKELKEEKKAKRSKEQANKEKVKLVKERVKAKIESKSQSKAEVKALKDIEKHWAKDSILRMQVLGVVGGYEDDTFKPQNEVTEAEAISLIVRLFCDDEKIVIEENTDETIDDQNDEVEENQDNDENEGEDEEVDEEAEENDDEFADAPEWVQDAAKKAKLMGVLNPNRFHSHVQASRAKTVVWVAKAMGLEPVDTSNIVFSDKILITPEDAGYIMALVNEGYLKGSTDGKFNPNSAITRAELVVIVDRILQEQAQSDDDEKNEDEELGDKITIEDNTDDETDEENEENDADDDNQ